ncbi:MAG TPA: hypothetical protein DCE41_34415 [Cytophagales bacterium]|nr:hypothetical protein [Cytophagales bacterium]
MAFNNAGATGNRWYVVWLFDPQAEEYVWDDFLSELSGISLNSETQELTSFETQGFCTQSWSTYAWQEHAWVETKRAYTRLNPEGLCERVDGEIVEGKMVIVSTKPYSPERR